MSGSYPSFLGSQTSRKVFLSHYHGHSDWTDHFLENYGDVFIRRSVGALGDDNLIDSSSPEYVMRRIREEYIGDSTVTVVLVGSCTHGRRYVDWEIKGSLRQSQDGHPNGLIAIQCSTSNVHLPPRFAQNWASGNLSCYARFYSYPTSKEQLRGWIEDAYSARTARAHLISNPNDSMMAYNARCNACEITH